LSRLFLVYFSWIFLVVGLLKDCEREKEREKGAKIKRAKKWAFPPPASFSPPSSSPVNHAKNKTPNPEKAQPVAYLASDTCQTRMMLSV